jgi:hypothetical protein
VSTVLVAFAAAAFLGWAAQPVLIAFELGVLYERMRIRQAGKVRSS